MSGQRCSGSSAGSGRAFASFDLPLTSFRMLAASSYIEISTGLPRLTGPVKSSGVSFISRQEGAMVKATRVVDAKLSGLENLITNEG
jgi:hypothetical protein